MSEIPGGNGIKAKSVARSGSPHSTGKNFTYVKKKPPPETPEGIRIRTLVISSFWAIVILFGLPIWWKTTTIYRAQLPLAGMGEWADGKICRPVFPLQISVEAKSLHAQEAKNLLRTTQHALDDLNDFSAHHLRLQLAEKIEPTNQTDLEEGGFEPGEGADVALTVKLLPGESGSTPHSVLQPYSPTLEVYYSSNQIPSTSSSSSPLASFIANKLQDIFAEEQAMIAYILSANPSSGGILAGNSAASPAPSAPSNGRETRSLAKVLPAELTASLAKRTTRTMKYASTYHLTISLFTPGASPSTWAIESAISEYLAPLLQSLSPISNFTIDTQVQLYASFSPSVREPEYDEALSAWTLRKEDLSGFINAAEWPLSPSIGVAPTINFILYVPDPAKMPLVVQESGSNSWLVPQWGGVTILNTQEELTVDTLRPALLTFSHQLLSLLGLPQSPPSLPLRLLTLTRARSASLILSASSTLGSLARLTQALPSISIPKTVASSVDRTLSHLAQACKDLREGRFEKALENARQAEEHAEKGFFEKSMVGQVYFPDEHKVAVYLPLLGPVGVPLVMAAGKEIRRIWLVWRQRKT
ncbi:MAG: GPI transamidase component [Vezdaea acicularis]|nr:MAG: GPI transamidase component [Vezdaea acicularis]